MSVDAGPVGGLYEHIYGVGDLKAGIRYWRQLGYVESERGTLEAAAAEQLYGVKSNLTSVRLHHQAIKSHGIIRLMKWDAPEGPGLGHAHALVVGSRWSGFYVKDILEICDAYRDQAATSDENWTASGPNRLPVSADVPSFYEPFYGIRESFVKGDAHRHAFLSRVKIHRPGFGSFAEGTPLACSEAVHGNLVMPSFDTHGFYPEAFGLTEHSPTLTLDWTMPPIRNALDLEEGQSFSVVVYQTPDEPSGLLRIYGMASEMEDMRHRSKPGELGLCCFSYKFALGSIADRVAHIKSCGGDNFSEIQSNEFGEDSVCFEGPDGIAWHIVG